MKNRRNVIIGFLLCACLIVGVGYANVSGQLIIGGNARFNGQSELTNKVKEAVIFSAAVAGENCTNAAITDTAKKTADMTVVINDAVGTSLDGTAAEFQAIASYTITYDTTEAYPDVKFSTPVPTITSLNGHQNCWNITAVFQNATTGASTDGSTATLSPGASVDVIVTVTFDNNPDGNTFREMDNATISIPLNYITVEE